MWYSDVRYSQVIRKEEGMHYAKHAKRLVIGVVFAFSVVMIGGAGSQDVWAQSNANGQSGGGRGQGIEISPPRLQLDADPGETVTAEIHIRNITDLNMRVQGNVNDFVAGNESGEPQILFEDEESPYPLKRYISNVPSLTLEPDERKTVQIEINVPENAAPGGHFGLVRFSGVPTDASNDSSQVNLSASIGTLILLSVSGDVNEQMAFEQFAVAKKDGNTGTFFETGPFSLITRLDNTGNVHLQPTGSLTITNVFDQEVAGAAFNKNNGNVLPGNIRRFENSFDKKEFWIGRYTATAQLQYGSDDTTLKEQVVFWVVPYKIIAGVLIMLAAVIFFGRRALRMYKRSIVRQYQQQDGSQQQSSDSSNHHHTDQHPPGE